jgi:hypothetical protein
VRVIKITQKKFLSHFVVIFEIYLQTFNCLYDIVVFAKLDDCHLIMHTRTFNHLGLDLRFALNRANAKAEPSGVKWDGPRRAGYFVSVLLRTKHRCKDV